MGGSISKRLLHENGGYPGSDEADTPEYGASPIVKYIPKDLTVWCPFDFEDSQFVKLFRANGNKVECSHIGDEEKRDFFKYEPEQWDVIVSNPPFKDKRKFFERAISFGKPFALLMTNAWLNDSAPKVLFKDIGLQLLMFDNRMLFIKDDGVTNKITFSSSYFCRDILPKRIIIEHIMTPTEFKKLYKKESKK